MADYTLRELMTIAAAREIPDGAITFCGTGISMVAAMAAKHINAPNSTIFFETGAIDSLLEELPLAVADPRVMYYTAVNGALTDAFAYMQNRKTGKQVVGIMGAAQIDCYGNLNSTVIGDYDEPTVRFSGSGGASDVASFVDHSLIFMQHEKRKFVNKVDYLTSPGWLDGAGGRERAGLTGKGPSKVITNMAIMGFDDTTKEMVLESYYPGITPQKILDNMEFEVDISNAKELRPPTNEEIIVLREKCDPQGLIL
jgi:glutaconate CoA-transferase subunit B